MKITQTNANTIHLDVKNFDVSVDYRELFYDKRDALCDVIQDGGELEREDVRDLMETAGVVVSKNNRKI